MMSSAQLSDRYSKTAAAMDGLSRFYIAASRPDADYLALHWKGRVRYTVPREAAGQRACWDVFRPGRLTLPMRAAARFPRLLGSSTCAEGPGIQAIRQALEAKAGLSCCRSGAAGPWSKETMLFLDKQSAKPLVFAKAGVGGAVGSLLQNEAKWLGYLGEDAGLRQHLPQLLAHRCEDEFSFVAQLPLAGVMRFEFGQSHIDFLLKLYAHSFQLKRFNETRLYRNLQLRMRLLSGYLSEAWSTRLDIAMRRIEQTMSEKPQLFVIAHNDFTPWNTRVEQNVAGVFDWEYADAEHLPLFDPIHFHLLPMGLKGHPALRMASKIAEVVEHCRQWAGAEICCEPEAQALAYLVNLSTLYLHAEDGKTDANPVLLSYGLLIDHLCKSGMSAQPSSF
jgi:hypothetical protein